MVTVERAEIAQIDPHELAEMAQKAALWDGLKDYIQQQEPDTSDPVWRTKLGVKVLNWVFGDGDPAQGRRSNPFTYPRRGKN